MYTRDERDMEIYTHFENIYTCTKCVYSTIVQMDKDWDMEMYICVKTGRIKPLGGMVYRSHNISIGSAMVGQKQVNPPTMGAT